MEKETTEREGRIYTRRLLHANAEVGFDLPKTRKIITDTLDKEEVEYKTVGKGSLVARVGQGKCASLLRADIDALPLREESALPFASKNDTMHACGHDMHTAMLLGALSALKKKEQHLPTEVRFLFQASEENLEGAHDAISSGILQEWDEIGSENEDKCKQLLEKHDNFFVKRAFSIHCIVGVPLKCGTLVVSDGGVSASASTFFSVRVFGENAHGGAPHLGKDALCALHAIYSAFLSLPERSVSLVDMPLISVGQMKAGNAPNVIASEGEMLGTVRTRCDDTQKTLTDALSETAQEIAVAYGVRCEFSVLGHAPTLCNDSALADLSLLHLKRMFAPDCVLRASEIYGGETQKQNGGSEDFANFSHLVPSLLIGICAGDSRGGYTFPLHHPSVRFDEDALHIGAKVYETLATLPISDTE